MADMREQAEKRHEELVQLFSAQSESAQSDTVSLINKRLFDLGNSTTSLLLLPATPKIFYGRDGELHKLIHLLLQDPARVAILGPGGIGKTSLALAALHHPDVSARYINRHFVSCESAASPDELVSSIVSHLGLEPSRNAPKHIFRHFLSGPPSVLLLDNLETAWEPLASQSQVEEVLSLLTDIPHLTLLVTMRGAERPGRVRWTRPFLAPLEPLTDVAAEQTFTDITGGLHDDRDVRELLGLTDNVPLALQLVANIAAFEGYDTVLSRWQREKTSLFSEGRDKRSNLDLSIGLSLSSPRMLDSPGALQLLSLLSLLPDGISETDLLQIKFPIAEMGRSKTTLMRTSLVSLSHDKRLRVLVPIREYIQHHSPPPAAICRPLRRFLHGLIMVWKDYQHLSTAGITPRIAANMGNFRTVLAHGLDWNEPDLTETLYSIVTFDSFCRISGKRSSGMLDLVPPYLEHLSDHRLHSAYLTEFIVTGQYHTIPDPAAVERIAVEHCRLAGNVSGEDLFLRLVHTIANRGMAFPRPWSVTKQRWP
ncbi:P-loop containing nucleoside triphosphate hydrolase protein [Mycena rosella]|uniref:P-loop containing nucleoside triphosphate hydrolase protein n=1 Tax=Mycena rosella TaxID=1033263 RepID=A0AAD7GL57_MYCRO|nr:P-loop containing nucleoside triphosphate hydrolase protein [Mycena rosella]